MAFFPFKRDPKLQEIKYTIYWDLTVAETANAMAIEQQLANSKEFPEVAQLLQKYNK